MPMWGGYWGMPWGGFGWIFPLIGLAFMVVMAFGCFRIMGRCMTHRAGPSTEDIEGLRTEVQELREEVRRLRARS